MLLTAKAAMDKTNKVRGEGGSGTRIGRGHGAPHTWSCHLCLRSCVALVEVWYREGHRCERLRTHCAPREGVCV